MTRNLYRCFDDTGRLLYVGCTTAALRRLSKHLQESGWAKRTARVEIEHFASKKQALEAERKAIREEDPQINVMCKKAGSPIRRKNTLSRQRKWQLKQMALGNCQRCGQPRTHYPTHCDKCVLHYRKYNRKKTGARRRYITRLDRQP